MSSCADQAGAVPDPFGDADGVDTLLPVVYEELHRLAGAVLARHRVVSPTRTTSLIQDVYLRLSNRGLCFRDRGHFLAIAAQAMRQVLIDRVRRQTAQKRGAGVSPLVLSEGMDAIVAAENGPDLIALDEALGRLAALDPVKARIVELRFFGGLTIEEAAEVVGGSVSTAKNDWRLAKAWLFRELSNAEPPHF